MNWNVKECLKSYNYSVKNKSIKAKSKLGISFLELSAFELNGNILDYSVYLGHFLGEESHDFPGSII